MTSIPPTEPGNARNSLGFAPAVLQAFEFLEKVGFQVIQELPTMVRYESEQTFVVVFHGRSSYELGVEVGHQIAVDGREVDEKFALSEIIAMTSLSTGSDYRSFSSTDREQIPGFLHQLAEWTRSYGAPALRNDPGFFEQLRAAGVRRSDAMQDDWRASQLRNVAESAWSAKDFGRVVDAYGEMLSELRTVPLRESELAKLRFAQDQLD